MMIRYLIEKEFKQIIRNSFLPKLIFVFPFVMMLIMPWAASFEIKNINVSIIDDDHSAYSERLVQKIAASTYFKLVDVSANYKEAMKSIESNEADLILEIAPGFEKDLVRNGSAKVMISANAVNGTKGGMGSAYLSSILNDYAGEIRNEWVQTSGKSTLPQITISSQNRFNPHLNYKLYIIPALMVALLTVLCGFLPAFNIVGEKEKGTIEQLNVTPVGKFTFILAKLIPYWIMGLLVISICFGLAAFVYNLVPAGSFLTIYLFSGIYILTVSGVGLVISNSSATMQQALFVIFFFMLIFILISGMFTPIDSMPGWAQALTTVNPLKYFMQVMRAVYLKGSGVMELIPQMIALACFALFFNIWAVLSYRKSS